MRPLRLAAPRSKYKAVPTVVDGLRFASKAEAQRWAELKLLEKACEIFDLQRQVSYSLCVMKDGPNWPIGEFIIDFVYLDLATGQWIFEDVKGMKTLPLARWKMKHFEAQYGITVREVRMRRPR